MVFVSPRADNSLLPFSNIPVPAAEHGDGLVARWKGVLSFRLAEDECQRGMPRGMVSLPVTACPVAKA